MAGKDKIIFMSEKNPASRRDWSGIPYFMFQALQEFYDVEYLPTKKFTFAKNAAYYLSKTLKRVTGRKYVFDYGNVMALLYGRSVTKALRERKGVKFVFVPAGLTEICKLHTPIPIVAAGDCSTIQLFEYYPSLFGVSRFSVRDVANVERKALTKCARVIFSSHWAAHFVKKNYGVDSLVVPFGANIAIPNPRAKELKKDGIDLMVVGVDWERKGGDIALAIQCAMLSSGIPSRLTIVGMRPKENTDVPENVLFTSIDKDSQLGEEQYFNLLAQADLLLLPTWADCTPIVIAEAFAAGLPVLSTDTGGIASMIDNGKTGFLFKPGDADAYVRCIANLLGDPEKYHEISENCLKASREIFNWHRWAAKVKQHCIDL